MGVRTPTSDSEELQPVVLFATTWSCHISLGDQCYVTRECDNTDLSGLFLASIWVF